MNGYGDTGGSFLGLGFSHNHGGQEAAAASAPSLQSSPIDAADSLMKHYLQQCLDFHDDQQQQQQQQQQHAQEETAPQFVTAQHPPAPPPAPIPAATAVSHVQMPPTSQAVVVPTTEQTSASSVASPSVSDPLAHPSAQEAIAKAQAIVQKFQQQQQHSHFALSSEGASAVLTLPADYRRRRLEQLAKEQERLHKATLKNFSYVAKREEARLKQQLAQIQQTKVMEQELHQQHATLLQNKREKQQALSTKAGIGTVRRQTLEKAKQQKGHVVKMNDKLTIAIYLSGLPSSSTNNNDAVITHDNVRQLFASYGDIRRVHLYRHKQTGELKGDALVVYNVRREAERQELLNAVCSQMNGAELPCGSSLRVEPADPQHNQRQPERQDATMTRCGENVGYYGPASSSNEKREKEESPVVHVNGSNSGKDNAHDKSNDCDDDLDDFFDSL